MAEAIARQPSAAAEITGAVNLPLFLLEGVAILAEVFIFTVVLLKYSGMNRRLDTGMRIDGAAHG